MYRASLAALVLGWAVVCGARAEDAPATVTRFQLRDGSKIEALAYAVMTVNNSKAYLITTLEGKRQVVVEKDVISRAEESVPFEKLSEKAQQEVLNMRAAAGAQAEAGTDKRAQQDAAAGRRRAYEARTALKKAEEALAEAKTVRANAEKIVKDMPVVIAKADAQYESAKAELSGTNNAPRVLGPYGTIDHQRADDLRDLMVRASEDKVRAEQSKREAQDVIASVTGKIRQLEESIDTAKKDLEALEADAKADAQKAKEEAREREKKIVEVKVEKPPQDTLTVLTLKDGTVLKALMILEDADGRLALKDEQGKLHYLSAQDVVKREQSAK